MNAYVVKLFKISLQFKNSDQSKHKMIEIDYFTNMSKNHNHEYFFEATKIIQKSSN